MIHCSATKEGKYFDAKDIDNWHKNIGWKGIGYHYVIRLDGAIEVGRPLFQRGAHVRGYNKYSIGICYIGGLDKDGKAKDTRTVAQKLAMFCLLQDLKEKFESAEILGHRDLSKDLNGNGVIEPFEFTKMCPCFDAKKEYKDV